MKIQNEQTCAYLNWFKCLGTTHNNIDTVGGVIKRILGNETNCNDSVQAITLFLYVFGFTCPLPV